MASGSSDGGNVCPWPASILLAEEAYVGGSRNDTTARARSTFNRTVEITFWIADPPAVSFYTFRCMKAPNSDSKDVDLRVRSAVAGAHGRFVLVRTLLASIAPMYEYFIYKGHPKSPSLESIPPIPFLDMMNGAEFGIVPRGDDGHYLLIALRDTANDYRLHIYSSEDATWGTKELPNPCPEVGTIMPDKVFTLGDGFVLWVDLLQGMLLCDVLREPLLAQYIPLPEPLPGNREKVKKCLPGVKFFRDLTCVDGLIKFVEIERREIVREITDVPPEKPFDPRTEDVLYDLELIRLSKRKPVENKPKLERSVDGWSAIVWTREIGSNFWRKGSVVDVNDILVDDSVFSALLSSNKSESSGTGSLTFKNMISVLPTLMSTDGNDILYLKSYIQQLGFSVLAAVDLVEKTLKVEAPGAHPVGKYNTSLQTLRPCALANQLKMTPGIKVSASQIALMGSSANEPNSTAIRVAEPFYQIPRQLAEKVNHAQNGAQSKIAPMGSSANKPNSTAIRVGEPISYESENKRPRLLAEKVNHVQNGAQSTVQNVLISQAHPNQNNMPPRLCFNRYQQPGYSGYSSWPHQNNPPPAPAPSCFNNWAGPYNPIYAPSAPAPNIQSYVNYQSLPQQPLLPEQQITPSMAFGPHMAHRPIYTSTTGMEPYAYGAHSGSGIYHQR
ncbi:uncharacterized protein LOC8060792 isoform X1 [Sorghum bicolor]|uniref:DUF1618 domain-containing protein n=1 Tax=Sorghum bicolor TaxID=4558 RepID=A0A1B6Q1S0_SORBI|nr:uncharacterized protein LOC8060792 isoform X1 [Sorghum bicolor]KXG31872.1 hypothetical protein SORBI_3003G070400 [Sorghum bicolor]|eukprot:XP_021313272.1 uncharacterized protein LOC8060792 isoform X1 [Sorghum bicolor]